MQLYDIDNDNDPYAATYQIRLLKEDQKTIIPLMNIDKGIIYKAKGDIHFAKWADISEFGRFNVEHSKTALWCERFDIFCHKAGNSIE
jgi:hypothetical protein